MNPYISEAEDVFREDLKEKNDISKSAKYARGNFRTKPRLESERSSNMKDGEVKTINTSKLYSVKELSEFSPEMVKRYFQILHDEHGMNGSRYARAIGKTPSLMTSVLRTYGLSFGKGEWNQGKDKWEEFVKRAKGEEACISKTETIPADEEIEPVPLENAPKEAYEKVKDSAENTENTLRKFSTSTEEFRKNHHVPYSHPERLAINKDESDILAFLNDSDKEKVYALIGKAFIAGLESER